MTYNIDIENVDLDMLQVQRVEGERTPVFVTCLDSGRGGELQTCKWGIQLRSFVYPSVFDCLLCCAVLVPAGAIFNFPLSEPDEDQSIADTEDSLRALSCGLNKGPRNTRHETIRDLHQETPSWHPTDASHYGMR